MKNGEKETAEGIELLNQESIRMLGEKENYHNMGTLEADTIKKEEMKEKRKEYFRRTINAINHYLPSLWVLGLAKDCKNLLILPIIIMMIKNDREGQTW